MQPSKEYNRQRPDSTRRNKWNHAQLLLFSAVIVMKQFFAVTDAFTIISSPILSSSRPSNIKNVFLHTTTTPPAQNGHHDTQMMMMMIPPLFLTDLDLLPHQLISVVETFDGSTIVDPIVVSSVFWSRLSKDLVSFFVGQLLAGTVFSIIIYILKDRFKNICFEVGDYVSKNIFRDQRDRPTENVVNEFVADARIRSESPPIKPNFQKLFLCLTIDTIGTSSELLPFIGELTDIIWAPIAALTLRSLFGRSNVIFALEFVEEFLPFTDILPLATLCWLVETFYGDSDIAKVLQIGLYGSNNNVNVNVNANVEGSTNSGTSGSTPIETMTRDSSRSSSRPSLSSSSNDDIIDVPFTKEKNDK